MELFIAVNIAGVCPATLMRINDKMDAVIAAQMTANGAALVVKNNKNDIENLGGKTIASVNPVTIQNVFMMYVADKYGFQLVPVDQGGQSNQT